MKISNKQFAAFGILLFAAILVTTVLLQIRNHRNSVTQAAFYKAVVSKDTAEVKRVLTLHPDLLLKFELWHGCPLHTAITLPSGSFSMEMVFLLIEASDPNHRNGQGRTALAALAKNSHMRTPDEQLRIAAKLLAKGTEINAEDYCGWTALHWAVSTGSTEMIELLLKNGAQTDVQEYQYGFTPLHLACLTLNPDAGRLLTEAGAPPHLTDLSGRTPAGLIPLDLQNTRWSWNHPKSGSLFYKGPVSGTFGIVTYRTNEQSPAKIREKEESLKQIIQGN